MTLSKINFNTHLLIVIISLIGVSTIGNSSQAYAKEPWRSAVSKVDYHTLRHKLPPFCQVDVKNKPPFNGPNYKGDMTWGNHLCQALVQIPVCRTYFGKERVECLNVRTKDYTYWITHAKNPNFGLLPYLHTGLAGLYFEVGKRLEAIQEYNLALHKNPKYLKAYKGLIDVYIDLGDLESAQKYLDHALTIKKLKSFKRRQKEINKLKNLQ